MKKTGIIFLCILGIAFFYRFWHFGGVPISPNWDEMAHGYNAYSLLKTGKDEFGIPWPVVLRSFDTYIPALYAYITIPFIALFDLTVKAVRLPSVIMGMLAVFITFFLTRQILALDTTFSKKRITTLALITMVLLAISPWHIQFSRYAHEANVSLTFCLLGLYFFLLGLKQAKFYSFSALFYGLSLHTYQSPRLFVPLFIFGLLFLFRSRLVQQKKALVLPLIIGLIIISPFMFLVFTGQSKQIFARFSETSVFSEKQTIPHIFTLINDIPAGYVSHFSLLWMFITGDNDRHHAPSTGDMYLFEAPFLLIGLYVLSRNTSRLRTLFFLWFFLAPTPAALTGETPHALRTILFLPSVYIATALGLERLFVVLHNKRLIYKIFIPAGIGVFALFTIAQYTHLYFYQLNHETSQFWAFGYQDAVSYYLQHKDKYKQVVISDRLQQPYIFFLFFLKYDPETYIAEGGTKLTSPKKFGIFEFRSIDWEHENRDHSTLFVLSPVDVIKNKIHTIRYFDGSESLVLAD